MRTWWTITVLYLNSFSCNTIGLIKITFSVSSTPKQYLPVSWEISSKYLKGEYFFVSKYPKRKYLSCHRKIWHLAGILTFRSAFSPGWTLHWPTIPLPAQWPEIKTWTFHGKKQLKINVGGRRLTSRPTLNPDKPNQDDISKSNLIESVLAAIGDVHKFDDLGLNKSWFRWRYNT